MKITHEIYGSVQSHLYGNGPYHGSVFDKPEYKGGRIEGVITSGRSPLRDYEDVFYLEGDIDKIKEMAEQILDYCNMIEEDWKDQVAAIAAKSMRCVFCGAYYTMDNVKDHHDGNGRLCQGDGTVAMMSREIYIVGGDSFSHTYSNTIRHWTQDLKKGDYFIVVDPIGSKDEGTKIALSDAFTITSPSHLEEWRVIVEY